MREKSGWERIAESSRVIEGSGAGAGGGGGAAAAIEMKSVKRLYFSRGWEKE